MNVVAPLLIVLISVLAFVYIYFLSAQIVDSREGFLIVHFSNGNKKAFCYGYSDVLRGWLKEKLYETGLPFMEAKGQSIRRNYSVIEPEGWILYGVTNNEVLRC